MQEISQYFLSYITNKEHKDIKKWHKISIIFIVVISALGFGGYYLLITKPVQNLIGKRVLAEMSKRTGTDFKASRVSFSNFRELDIYDLYIEDENMDTLLYAHKVRAILDSLNRSTQYVRIKSLELTSPIINISQDDSSAFNFMFILDSLSNPDKPDSLRWKVNFQDVQIENGQLSLALRDKDVFLLNKVNFESQVDQNNIIIEQLSFALNNGFQLKKTYAEINIEPQGIFIPKLSLTSENSALIFRNIAAESLDSVFKGTPLDQLQFHLQSNNSSISGCDISYFLPDSCKFYNEIIIDGNVSGNFDQLNGEHLHLMLDSIVDMHSTFEVQHIDDEKNMSFNIELNDLLIDIVGAANFFNQIMPNNTLDISPYAHWEELSYLGNISGVKNNFTTKGKVKTKYGTLNTDVSVVLFDSLQTIEYNGDISTKGFYMGRALLNTKVLGKASAQLFVSGGKQANGKFGNYFKGEVSELSLMDYNYSGITLEGGVGRGYFNGNLKVADENAKFDFSGEVDYLSATPVFNFNLDMKHLAMSELNLTNSYDQLDVNFSLNSRLEGKHIDDLNGFLGINELWVVTEHNSFNSDSILFSFKPLDAMPSIVLSSEYIDGLILGSYNFSELLGYFNTSLKKHLKYLPEQFNTPTNTTPNKFSFAFEIDDMNSMASTLDLPLRANGFSIVSGEIDSRRNVFNFDADIPYLLTKNQLLDSITIAVSNNDQYFDSEFNIGKFIFGGDHVMNDININFDIQQDTVSFHTIWDNEGDVLYTGDYKANIWLEPYGKNIKTVIESQPSAFIIADTLWHINKNQVSFLPHKMTIDSLIFASADSYFSLDGKASEKMTDTMRFEMDKFNLADLDRFLSIKNFTFDGIVSGKAELYSLLKDPVFVTDLMVDSMSLNKSEWGNMSAVTEWDAEQKQLELYVDCESNLEGKKLMSLSGVYHQENDSLDVVGDLSGFDISFIRPYVELTLSDLNGLATGQVDVRGSIKNPELYGALMVNDGSFRIDYLSTDFFVNDSIKFDKNRFVFDETQVQDQEGNYGRVTGDIVHTRYKNMLVDLIVESDRFLGLNTTSIENEYFFGDIYFGGAITIKSTHQETLIGSRAKTMPGSILTVPLSPISTASTNNFINYIVNVKEKDSTVNIPKSLPKEIIQPARALIIDMNFNVTSDATLRLEFDAQKGDAIEAVGNGNLNVQFQRGQPFQMFGEYKIDYGKYLFTMQQIFNKKFSINSGSTLRWSGKPGDAIMDITAQYPLRASLYNLMPEAIGESNKNRRVPVNVKMLLTERLSQPDISFDIELPNTDEETQQSVSSIIDTEEEMSRQVLSLLIMNSFYTPDYYADNSSSSQANSQLSSAAAVTASEFLSNQLSNWMSDISDNLDLGFRYIPEQELLGQGLTPLEYEVAISTQFFDDRLTVNGNVNYQDYTTDSRPPNLNSNFVGEVDVELKLNENLKLKAYSHQNDDVLYESSSMKQGAGVTYQEDFTTIKELAGRYKKRVGSIFKGKNRKNTKGTRKEDDEIFEDETDGDNIDSEDSIAPTDSIDDDQQVVDGGNQVF